MSRRMRMSEDVCHLIQLYNQQKIGYTVDIET